LSLLVPAASETIQSGYKIKALRYPFVHLWIEVVSQIVGAIILVLTHSLRVEIDFLFIVTPSSLTGRLTPKWHMRNRIEKLLVPLRARGFYILRVVAIRRGQGR
jgi:hypothetical protein